MPKISTKRSRTTKAPATSPADVIRQARESGVQVVDVRFTDLPGTWQHFSIPVGQLTEDVFEDGLGFDGSSIRGWQAINESDMLIVPQPDTAVLDPFCKIPTLSMICNIQDPITRGRRGFLDAVRAAARR